MAKTGITIDRASLARTLAAFDRLASPKARDSGIKRAGIKAVNTIGKAARSDVTTILAAIAGAKRSAIKPRSKAASRFQAEPNYRLAFPRSIPIAALSSSKIDKKTGSVEFRSLAGAVQRFHAYRVKGAGRRIRLPAKNPLPERLLGGLVFIASRRNPEVEEYARDQGPALARAFESEVEALLARVNRR